MIKSVRLHPLVRLVAKDSMITEGRLAFNEVKLVAAREAMLALDAVQKKAVVISLVAFASRLLREAKDGSEQAVERLMELAADVAA